MKRSERAAVVASIIEPYLTAKKDRTIITQYERVRGDASSRIRTVLSPVVTETGRLASGESFVDPASTNLQNISKTQGFKDPLYQVRDCFIPDPGFVLMAFDLDKAEAVVAAFESEDWDFYEALIAGADIHTQLAADTFHQGNARSVTKGERQVCKAVTYASLYIAGIPTITRTINRDSEMLGFKVTEEEVGKVHSTLLRVHPLEAWWDRVWSDLFNPDLYGGRRWLENCFGFRRMFYNLDDHSLHKEAVNFFPQSTVAGIIDRAMISAWQSIVVPDECELLLQVHDELVFQCRPSLVPAYSERMIAAMTEPFMARGREVYIPSGCEVGERWGSMRSLTRWLDG